MRAARSISMAALVCGGLVLASPLWAQPAGDPQAPAEPQDLREIPLDRLQAMVERPLFSPSRRAAPGSGSMLSALGDPASESTAFQLKGMVVAKDGGEALLMGAGGKAHKVAVGETVEGWTVRRITEQGVELSRDGAPPVVVPLRKHK